MGYRGNRDDYGVRSALGSIADVIRHNKKVDKERASRQRAIEILSALDEPPVNPDFPEMGQNPNRLTPDDAEEQIFGIKELDPSLQAYVLQSIERRRDKQDTRVDELARQMAIAKRAGDDNSLAMIGETALRELGPELSNRAAARMNVHYSELQLNELLAKEAEERIARRQEAGDVRAESRMIEREQRAEGRAEAREQRAESRISGRALTARRVEDLATAIGNARARGDRGSADALYRRAEAAEDFTPDELQAIEEGAAAAEEEARARQAQFVFELGERVRATADPLDQLLRNAFGGVGQPGATEQPDTVRQPAQGVGPLLTPEQQYSRQVFEQAVELFKTRYGRDYTGAGAEPELLQIIMDGILAGATNG
jgi:hypothetical protein